MNVELLTESEEDGWTVPILIFTDEDGEIDLRLFIDDGTGKLRPRRVAIFAIKNSIEYVNAAFVESLPLHLKIYATNVDHKDELNRTLSCASSDYIFRPESEKPSISKWINWIFNTDQSK